MCNIDTDRNRYTGLILIYIGSLLLLVYGIINLELSQFVFMISSQIVLKVFIEMCMSLIKYRDISVLEVLFDLVLMSIGIVLAISYWDKVLWLNNFKLLYGVYLILGSYIAFNTKDLNNYLIKKTEGE